MVTPGRFRAYTAVVFLLTLVSTATAKYSGGSGTAADPYQIATAADLIALGETVADYDRHFILTADIDLDPNLPGRKVFDKAVIAPDADGAKSGFQGTPFTGVFDGNGHKISHLTISGGSYLGLFGQLEDSSLVPDAQVKSLGVLDVNITGSGWSVGGLVGWNRFKSGTVTRCYSTGAVSGTWNNVGGLVGYNEGVVTQCYSRGTVRAGSSAGGLVGSNRGRVTNCYSTGTVRGSGEELGGLVGFNSGSVLYSVWDMKTSGRSRSAGGVGLTTGEMMDPYMLGLNGFANDPNWVLDAGRDYPGLAWQGTPGQLIPVPKIDWLAGRGTAEEPYRIDTADQLILFGKASVLCDRHLVLGADINLDPNLASGQVFAQALVPAFTGVFDGKGHTISHLTIKGTGGLGLFGQVVSGAEIRNLGACRETCGKY